MSKGPATFSDQKRASLMSDNEAEPLKNLKIKKRSAETIYKNNGIKKKDTNPIKPI